MVELQNMKETTKEYYLELSDLVKANIKSGEQWNTTFK